MSLVVVTLDFFTTYLFLLNLLISVIELDISPYCKLINELLFSISITRFEAQKAKIELEKQGYKIGIANILWIKPYIFRRLILIKKLQH